MKKIALVICIFFASLGAFAQSSSSSETLVALKAKIAKLESQIKGDIEVIRALRSENRELKRKIRKLSRKETSDRAAQISERAEKAAERADSNAEDASTGSGSSKSSGFHMFPF